MILGPGNWFATFTLVAWPLVALCLYQLRPPNQATLWTILGGWLLLPVGAAIKFEGIPQFDKVSIPNLAALIGFMLILQRPRRLWYGLGFRVAVRPLPRLWNGFGLPELLVLMFLISPFITNELNTDPLVNGPSFLPAGSRYDALSAVVSQFIFMLPFFLGRYLLRQPADNEEILRALVIAGLVYSLPILFEVRMSPQLHIWVYGYFPHDFFQQIRSGGFRAVVFLGHGLAVAFFLVMTIVAASALWRTGTKVLRVRVRLPAAGITAYLGAVLFLCKSLGSLIYAIVLVPLVRFARPKLQLRVAAVFALLVCSYPLLRAADLVPTELMLSAVGSVDEERRISLKTRFDQEEQLLDRALQRPLFGWGRFGRSRVYNPETGQDISISDGRWIITMGVYGVFGFVAEFGLLALTVLQATFALKFCRTGRDQVHLAALALLVAVSMIELIPNATLLPWTWLIAGALLGRAEALRSVPSPPGLANSMLSSERYRMSPAKARDFS